MSEKQEQDDAEPIKAPRGLCRYCGLPRFTAADLRRYARESRKQNKQRRQRYNPPWARAICWMSGGPHPNRAAKVEKVCDDPTLNPADRERR